MPSDVPVHDEIRLAGNDSGGDAVILTDFRSRHGCECDSIFRTNEVVSIGDARRTCGCNSAITVFGPSNAMSYEPRVRTWRRRTGDVHTVDLQKVIRVPVNIVVTQPGMDVRARQDVVNANMLFARNRVGVTFEPDVTDLSNTAVGEQIDERLSCSELQELDSTGYLKKGQMNVYYHARTDGARTCTGGDPNVIFIGTVANLASLAHEIGHSYGLLPAQSGGHVKGLAGFGNDNIMWQEGPPTRWRFSLGQVFRLNVRDTSQLNMNGLRRGPMHPCAPLTIDRHCPVLSLDAAP